MKKNRFIALALAAGMTFCNVAATGVVAYADDITNTNESSSTYTLTLKNSGATEHKFEVYQIFSGRLDTVNDKKTLSDINWGSGVNVDSDFVKTFTSAEDAANSIKTTANAETFADNINSSLTNKSAEITIAAGASKDVTVSAGYYLVKDADNSQTGDKSAYTLYLLQIVGNAEATTKLDVPSSLKKVKENSTNTVNASGTETDSRISDFALGVQYNDIADYSIGEAIPYELVGTLPSNYEKYTTYKYEFVDTMSKGLTLNESSVKVLFKSKKDDTKETDITSTATKTVTTSNETGKTTLTVSFTDLKTAYPNADKDSVIIVRYDAKLNENAVIGLDGNENTFHLVYSNNPNQGGEGKTGETPEDKNIVFTYELDNTKITYISEADYTALDATAQENYTEASYDLDNNGEPEKVYKRVLSGAKFKLYDAATKGKGAVVDANGKFVKWTETATEVTELVSDANGLFKIAGLDEGTYYLEETEAPSGYNKISGRTTIVITAATANGQDWDETKKAEAALTGLTVKLNDAATAVAGNVESGIVNTEIVNMPGAVLPSTGGVGTTIMYVLGGILVIGGGAAIFIKRKKDAE